MSNRWRPLVFFVLCCVTAYARAEAEPEIEPETEELGQDCVRYEYEPRDLAEQSESRLVFDAFDDHRGKTIRNIRYESRDIFDESLPEENNWLYRSLNRLHINTREDVVAAQLLFSEDEPLDIGLVRESERILRSRGYLTSAFIVPDVICPDHIDVLVVTRDSWVTEPELTFAHEGGETSSGIGIKDSNFLGTGEHISIGYSRDVERTSVRYQYQTPHLFRTRVAARIYYTQLSDGRDLAMKVEHPFYALDTPWAAGVETQNLTLTNVIREGDEIISEYGHRIRFQEVYGGLSLLRGEDNTTLRWLAGLTFHQDRFQEQPETVNGIPEDRRTNYAWLGLTYSRNEYATYRNLYQIQRTEDVALGPSYELRAGFGSQDMGNSTDVMRYAAQYDHVFGMGNSHVVELSAFLDGYHFTGADGYDTAVAGVSGAYNRFRNGQNRWFVHLEYGQGWELRQHEELTVGGISGLRGYPIDFQRGEHRYILNVERRYFSNVHLLNVVRMGGVAFFDAGRAWGLEANGSNPHLANVGLGLRFSSSKARVGNILHIDIARPLASREGVSEYQLLLKTEGHF
ncbi:hypothetical protein [Marinimicrobium sp. ABcell2]|uniref:hypothetical protein n=1 Tax=Marinimicrobium sp. ABcell2 TaxID=3069751 RepID=UPI0027B2DD6D|nr:hypothetical protein [Marinimicrobium sp. ABcell2]MDQ2078461.1 BamA/TamA family outer membrane protein [Marinimicrobium sp. ABcell2]